ncbi:MAG TPA: tetratricopeptide repeat protein, partial [Myxococcales bacterium]|nr:tetratricopeptide repeat protein [Myxococcales bacterium]
PPPAKSAAPAWIHALLVRALSFDREARFPGMGALLEALERDPTVRRRQRWRAAGVTLAAAAVVAGAVAARSTAQRRCAPPESRWAGVWDDARRAGVRQAFARTGKPFARAASDTVDRALDRYRADWLSMLQASCLATLDGAQPRDVLDLRTDCLDRRLAGARALVERLAAADGTVVQNAVSAVGDLQPVSECADEQALRAGAAWPLDPARRGEVEAVRAQVESARALNAVGSMAAALEVARGAAARAEATGYKPLIADAELLLSLVHFRLYDTQSAIAASHRAAAAAQETGQMDLVIQAWIHLTHWTATEGGDGSPWSAYTEALLHRRSGDTRVLWASLRRSQAVVALDSRRYPQAMALARESLELSQQALGEDHPQSSQALRTMAAAAWYLGDLEAALAAHRRGAEIERRVEGLDHPRYAEHLADMAGISIEQGDWEGALRLLDQAEPIFKRAFPARHPWRTMMVQYRAMALAHQEVERGAPLGAEAMAREELKALEQSAGRDDEWAVSLSAVLGNVLRIHGRCAEAVPIFQRVRDTLAPHAVTAEQQWDLAEAREELGACLLATGKPDRALPELRQSVKWFEENGSRNFLRGEGLYLLAQAQWQTGARDGARASAAAARELLAAVSPRGRKLAAEVDRWIAAR